MKIKKRKVLPKPGKTEPRKYSGSLRAAIKERSLRSYRKSKSGFELSNCLRSLEYFAQRAERLWVSHKDFPSLGGGYMPVFSPPVVAELLEKSYQSFWRWTTGDEPMVPPPVLLIRDDWRERKVYHLEEVRHLIKTIGEHGRHFAYYRKDHMMTRKKLFDGIETIRNETILQELRNGFEKARNTPKLSRKAGGKGNRKVGKRKD